MHDVFVVIYITEYMPDREKFSSDLGADEN